MLRKQVLVAVIGGIVGAVLTMVVGVMVASESLVRGDQSDSVFEKVTCRELEVVDAEGNRRVVLSEGVSEEGLWGGSIVVYGNDDGPRARMVSTEDGGVVGAVGKNSSGGVSMGVTEGAGVIILGDANGVKAGLYSNAHGGRVVVDGNDGQNRAIMGVSADGNGVVSTWDKDSNHLATLGAHQ
ncbi:MAG: hypothetical protein OXT74_01205 [Candidatus Poribacteria bacterium]|nr:hypothetical protein [Candidatus Poribacteria bacterium]